MPATPLTETPAVVDDAGARQKAANRRTAFVLLGIAAIFFVGIIATRFIGDATVGIGVMGSAVLLFLVVAIGRNLRMSERGEAKERSSRPRAIAAADHPGLSILLRRRGGRQR